jgi:hypothetical protein
MGLLKQLMIFGELWTSGASHAGDSFSLSLWPTRGYGDPPIHNMGFCSRLGDRISIGMPNFEMQNLDSVNHCTSKEITGTMDHCTSKKITGTMVD